MRRWIIALVSILLVAGAVRVYTALRCDTVPDYSDMATYNRIALGEKAPELNVERQSETRKRLYDKRAKALRRARGSKEKRAHAAALEKPQVTPPPGYPLFLKSIYGIFGTANYTAVFLVQAVLSTLSVLGIWFVASRTGGRAAGLVAAAIAAVYPNFVIYNLTTLTEAVGVFMVVTLMAVLVAPATERRRSIAAALVLLAGCAFRPPFLYFWPGLFVGLRKKTVFVAATLAVVLPVAVVSLIGGGPSNRAALAFYKSYNERADGVSSYQLRETRLGSRDLPAARYVDGALSFIRRNKWRTLDILYNKATVLVTRGWDSFVMKPLVPERGSRRKIVEYAWLPVMLAGLVGMLRLRGGRARPLFLMTASYVVFILALAIFKVRYRLMIEPAFIVFASMLVTPGGEER